jgi:hypothetical protein
MEFQDLIIILSGIGTSGAVAIAFLFKTVLDLSKKQSSLSEELGELRGKQEGVRVLSQDVLRTVHQAIYDRGRRRDD